MNTVVRRVFAYEFRQEPYVACFFHIKSNPFYAGCNTCRRLNLLKCRGAKLARNHSNFRRFGYVSVIERTVNLYGYVRVRCIRTLQRVRTNIRIVGVFLTVFNNGVLFYEVTGRPAYDVHLFGKRQCRIYAANGNGLRNRRSLIDRAVENGRNLYHIFRVGINCFVRKRERRLGNVYIIVIIYPYAICRSAFDSCPAQRFRERIVRGFYFCRRIRSVKCIHGNRRLRAALCVFRFYVKYVNALVVEGELGSRVGNLNVRLVLYALYNTRKIIGQELKLRFEIARRYNVLARRENFFKRSRCAFACGGNSARFLEFRRFRQYVNGASQVCRFPV